MPRKRKIHPVPANVLQSIGDVVVSFSLVETALEVIVCSLLAEHQRVGQIVCAELSFTRIRGLVASLYQEHHGEDDPDLATLRGLLNRASSLEHKRNQIVHSTWGAGSDSRSVSRLKSDAKERHGFRMRGEELSASSVSAIADDLSMLAYDLQTFWFQQLTVGKLINNPGKPIWGSTL